MLITCSVRSKPLFSFIYFFFSCSTFCFTTGKTKNQVVRRYTENNSVLSLRKILCRTLLTNKSYANIDAHYTRTFYRALLVKSKATPLQAWIGPEGSRRLKAPTVHDNRHMKMVRLSALSTGRLYPPGNIPGTHFC